MSEPEKRVDLIALVADKNMEFALRGLLSRTESLGIRSLGYDIFVHPEKDPGCLLKAHDFLRTFHHNYGHALVIFDREGCGREDKSREEIEQFVESNLSQSGWDDRGAVIVIDPELENWVWTNSPHVAVVLGWQDKSPDLHEWLVRRGFLESISVSKPLNPKQAVEEALRLSKKPRSSSLYLQLAKSVTLSGCTDKAFMKFRQVILRWFAKSGALD